MAHQAPDSDISKNDDKLAQLLGLGFDIDVCRAALLQNDSVQSATEWILGNETAPLSSTRPILTLDPAAAPSPILDQVPMTQHEISSVDKAKSRQDDHGAEDAARMRNESLKMTREAKIEKRRDKEARERALAQIKEDRERQKLLKGKQSEKSVDASKIIFASSSSATPYEKAQQEIKRQKRLDREAKNRALKEIQQDRENMKLRHASKTNSTAATQSATSSNQILDKKNAHVQFKLSNGTTVRQSFQADAHLSELYTFVREKELGIDNTPMGNDPMRLISAFPRREFTESDRMITVQDAGFVPNVSLNVVRPHPAESQQDPNRNIRQDRDVTMQDTQEENVEDHDDGDDGSDMDMDEPDPLDHPGLMAHQRRNANWNWDTHGHRLVDNDTENDRNEQQSTEQQVPVVNRQNMLSAIERRGAVTTTPSQQQHHARGKARDIRSLKDTCAISVAGFLTQPTVEASHRVKNLVYASSKVGELLLSQLMQTRKLERSSLQRLADHCYLQNVCLDSYVYATDSLLQELSLSNSSSTISKLSLKGCDVITDAGIRYIEGLKNLEYMDASNCKVTNKGLNSLIKLSQLRHLNLSKTKITDAGLHQLVENAHFQDTLEALLLDGCRGIKSKDTLLLINNAFSGLVTLGLASTGIGRQTVVTRPKLVNLQSLDISHTSLTDEDAIQTICAYKDLRELKLSGCHEITLRGLGAFAQYLRKLEIIQFPSREHDLDSVLPRYVELPLRHLDLTSFQVSDEGADFIARMKKLQYLSLDGTKITDEGVSKFSGLTDLRKLFLDRTTVSDEGISQLIGLTKLDTLSLSRTQVTNTLLILLGDFVKTGFTRCIRTLNLAQCQHVSDIGIRGLQGMVNLTNINLDHTNVSKNCLRHLNNLEHLKPVRLMGIVREEDEDESKLV